MATLDVVLNPAALRGYRWFLGQIYGYPEPGVHFGIPLAHFWGWFLAALLMISLLKFLGTRPFPHPHRLEPVGEEIRSCLGGEG